MLVYLCGTPTWRLQNSVTVIIFNLLPAHENAKVTELSEANPILVINYQVHMIPIQCLEF